MGHILLQPNITVAILVTNETLNSSHCLQCNVMYAGRYVPGKYIHGPFTNSPIEAIICQMEHSCMPDNCKKSSRN